MIRKGKGKSPAQRLLKSADLVEVGRLGRWRRLEHDSRIIEALEDQRSGLPGAQAIGGRRARGRLEPQSAGCARRGADFRRREGGPADRAGLLQTARGIRALELATARARWWNSGIVEAAEATPTRSQRVLKKTLSNRTDANTGSSRPRPAGAVQ